MLIRALFWLSALAAVAASIALVMVTAVIWADLPPTSVVQDIRLKEPLRVYSVDGRLMGEFGDERRITIQIEDTPQDLINAVLAAEDDRFFSHHGVDPLGVLRALITNLKSGQTRQGQARSPCRSRGTIFCPEKRPTPERSRRRCSRSNWSANSARTRSSELYVNKSFWDIDLSVF